MDDATLVERHESVCTSPRSSSASAIPPGMRAAGQHRIVGVEEGTGTCRAPPDGVVTGGSGPGVVLTYDPRSRSQRTAALRSLSCRRAVVHDENFYVAQRLIADRGQRCADVRFRVESGDDDGDFGGPRRPPPEIAIAGSLRSATTSRIPRLCDRLAAAAP